MSTFFRSIGIVGDLKRHKKFDVCDVCYRAKQTRNRFPISDNKASELFELIHCDIWGPYRVKTSCGASYFLTIVDDASGGTWVYLMKEKSEVEMLLKGFIAMTKNQFEKGVKVVRSDNGLEFKSSSMETFYFENGIVHQTSCIDTPQQNGRVERNHRHVLNVARGLRFSSWVAIDFLGGMRVDRCTLD